MRSSGFRVIRGFRGKFLNRYDSNVFKTQRMPMLPVSIVLLLLTLLVESGGMAKVPAQALAVAASTPLNFLGNKLWSFRLRA